MSATPAHPPHKTWTRAEIDALQDAALPTVDFDVKRKGRLYARSNFVEDLVMDVCERELLVFRVPEGGVYREMRVFRPGDAFSPIGAPESVISVAALFAE